MLQWITHHLQFGTPICKRKILVAIGPSDVLHGLRVDLLGGIVVTAASIVRAASAICPFGGVTHFSTCCLNLSFYLLFKFKALCSLHGSPITGSGVFLGEAGLGETPSRGLVGNCVLNDEGRQLLLGLPQLVEHRRH